MVILENIDMDIDMDFLENIDINKEILQNINIDKILYWFEFAILNSTTSRTSKKGMWWRDWSGPPLCVASVRASASLMTNCSTGWGGRSHISFGAELTWIQGVSGLGQSSLSTMTATQMGKLSQLVDPQGPRSISMKTHIFSILWYKMFFQIDCARVGGSHGSGGWYQS